jgi:hypothetical protein
MMWVDLPGYGRFIMRGIACNAAMVLLGIALRVVPVVE